MYFGTSFREFWVLQLRSLLSSFNIFDTNVTNQPFVDETRNWVENFNSGIYDNIESAFESIGDLIKQFSQNIGTLSM